MFIIQEIFGSMAEKPIILFEKREAVSAYFEIASRNGVIFPSNLKIPTIEELIKIVNKQRHCGNHDWEVEYWEINTKLEDNYREAIELLDKYLYESVVDNEFDKENYDFLRRI